MFLQVWRSGALFAGEYALLGAVHQRLGGAGVVQFASRQREAPLNRAASQAKAKGTAAKGRVALKFYIVRAAFDRVLSAERARAAGAAGAIVQVVANNEGAETGARPRGWRACIARLSVCLFATRCAVQSCR